MVAVVKASVDGEQFVLGRQREPEDGTVCGSNTMTWTTLTGIFLGPYIRPQSIICKNPNGVANYVHVPAGLVTSSILLTSFGSPCAILSEGTSILRSRFDVQISSLIFQPIAIRFDPMGVWKAPLFWSFSLFSPRYYLAGCLLKLQQIKQKANKL